MAVTVSVEQLGSELRRRRDEGGLTLRDVETQTGISAATLSRIERGSTPETKTVGQLAEWLGVNVVSVGEESSFIRTDEDLKRTISLHLRASKNLPDTVAQSIVEAFEFVMELEIHKAKARGKIPE